MSSEATVSAISGDVVAVDVCELEFDRFVQCMDLDVDPQGMDDDDKKSFVSAKRIVIGAMRTGNLIVNEAGEMVFTPQKGDTSPITFYEPTGATMLATDNKKKDHDIAKSYAAMADMTRQSIQRFTRMANRDLKVCQYIQILFLA